MVNVHLFWNPACADVKILQFWACARKIDEFYAQHQLEEAECPVVWCGDFNSLPRSAVVQLAVTGRVEESHPEWKPFVAPWKIDIRVEKPFKSVFSPYTHFTNYTERFKGIIDYIFVRNMTVRCVQFMGTNEDRTRPQRDESGEWYRYAEQEDWELNKVTEEEFRQGAQCPSRFAILPSRFWPSDHLALSCRLEFQRK